MSDSKFVDGLIIKAPNENAPHFVKCKISIKREELIAWLQKQEGDWINLDVKESGKTGKWYASIDNWKPSAQPPKDYAEPAKEFDDDIPF